MNYRDALAWVYGRQSFGIKLGLDNTRRLLAAAGDPHARLRFLHVAGTNGKGSTCAMMDAILRADTSALPAWLGVDLGAQGYAVARVNKVLPRNAPPAAVAEQERGQMARWLAGAEWDAYYEVLKKRFKVQIKVAKPQADGSAALAAAE